MRKFLLTIASCLLMPSVYASPERIEMIFLSPKKLTSALELINQYERIKFSSAIVQNQFPENCTPFGDGCFHPQLGYLEIKKEVKQEEKKAPAKDFKLKTFNATDVSLINCDPNNYFDIYCGKESNNKEVKKKAEIWFDISSSIRTVDYSNDNLHCDRRMFLEKVVAMCGKKVGYSVFNTSLKEAGEFASVCEGFGTNDQKKLLKWIKSNETKNLLIITDVDEISHELRQYLEKEGAKIQGDGVTPFTSQDLIDYAKDFSKMCS